MTTSPGSTTIANLNARQINSDYAIRNRSKDQSSNDTLNSTTEEDSDDANED